MKNLATCVYHASGKTHRRTMSYKTSEELAEKTFRFEVSFNYQPDVFLVHDVANGVVLHWNSSIANACFAKGRISETELVSMLSRPIR